MMKKTISVSRSWTRSTLNTSDWAGTWPWSRSWTREMIRSVGWAEEFGLSAAWSNDTAWAWFWRTNR